MLSKEGSARSSRIWSNLAERDSHAERTAGRAANRIRQAWSVPCIDAILARAFSRARSQTPGRAMLMELSSSTTSDRETCPADGPEPRQMGHGRGERRHQQEQPEAAQKEEQEMVELAAPVFLDGNPAQEHEGGEEHAVSLVAANQVKQDGDCHGQGSEEEEGGQELHDAPVSQAPPPAPTGMISRENGARSSMSGSNRVAHGERLVGATLVVALPPNGATLGWSFLGPVRTGWRRNRPAGE